MTGRFGRTSAWLRASWVGYAAALVAVALVSVVSVLASGRIQVASIAMLSLFAVLVVAVGFGRGPAIVASFAAFLIFDWFFVEPRHTFSVASPDAWLELVLLLVTGLLSGQLAATLRQRALEAEQREREAVVLYDVVRLMNEADLEQSLRAVSERLRVELGLAAVEIQLPAGTERLRAAAGDPESLRVIETSAVESARMLGTGKPPTARERGQPGRWVRVVPPTAGRRAPEGGLCVVPIAGPEDRPGAVWLLRTPNAPPFGRSDERLLSAIASQLGLIVEREQLRRQAMEAEVLRGADELKSALLNAVSHDLRTPLATILAAAGSLRQRDVAWTDEDRAEFAEAIEEEARRLDRIVRNLLDLSRIQSGTLHPDRNWHDLGALITSVAGRLQSVTAGHRVSLDVEDNLPPVRLDYVEIDQVLSNLIENAVKYAPAGTEIRVSARRVGDQVRVSVADEGPGISPAALPQLFQPYYRAPGVNRQATRGLGLGLSVSRGLVGAHGGWIRAENRPTGGACFSFGLPIDAVRPVVAAQPGPV